MKEYQTHPTWTNLRACIVGLALGNIAGAIHILPFFPVGHRLDIPFEDGWLNTADMLATAAWAVGVYVAPPIVSWMSSRLTFLWGFLPVTIFFSWDIVAVLARYRNGWQFVENGALRLIITCVIAVLLTSGPVSLYRWLIGRKSTARTAREHLQQSVDDVWPPPPSAGAD